MTALTWTLVAAVGLFLLAVVFLYNRLVRARNRVEEGWAQIDVQLRRRHDLIPNLVEAVRGYAAHEERVLTAVTEARARAIAASGPADTARAEQGLEGALRSLFAVAEGYPQLRASESFLELQRELTTTEDRVAYSRQFYNSAVRDYDDRRQTFPSNLVAGAFGFGDREYYETDDEARAAPRVAL
ncbi:MAG: LemA family protein [Nitriliruptorales bacterium]